MKIGVVGWGLRGKLASLVESSPKVPKGFGATVTALADPSEEARTRFSEAHPSADSFSSYQDLLNLGLDAVFILSPDWLHEEHAQAFLRAGVPTFLEKPMAITIAGCDAILSVQRETGTKLYLGNNMRHFGVVAKMKQWIDQGLIGNVKAAWCRHFISYGGDAYFRDWHADRTKSTGLLLQKGAHDIDILHYLSGGFAKRVSAMGGLTVYGNIASRQEPGEAPNVAFNKTWPPRSLEKLNPIVDVEDLTMMQMELDNGVFASYQQCHFTPDAWRNYTIIGDEGRLENFGDAPGKSVVRLWDHARYAYEPNGDLEYRVPEVGGWHGGSDDLMIAEFLKFVAEEGPCTTSPLAARMAVAAGIVATESLRSCGSAREVPAVR